MELKNLYLELKSGILTITIDRPAKLNVLDLATIGEIDNAFQKVYDESEIKAVILTGRGDKSFVAGADISEMANLNQINGRKFAENGQELFSKIENCPKPVIAAVNGFALGGGCELAMACHMRLAAENAKFGLPEVGLGILPGYGGTQRLPMLVGKAKAMEMILTGNIYTAAEVKAIGLVNDVVPQQELLVQAQRLLEIILTRASLAVSQAIESINAHYASNQGYQAEANAFSNCCKTADFKEGINAFLQKRKPIFTGK